MGHGSALSAKECCIDAQDALASKHVLGVPVYTIHGSATAPVLVLLGFQFCT